MGIVDLIFPKSCINCGREGVYICKECIEKVKSVKQICCVCSKVSIDGVTHVKCKTPHSLERVISLWQYKGAVRKAILGLKYKYATEIAKELSGLIAEEIEKNSIFLPKKVILVPIPMHKARQRKRGFNQAEEIGKHLASQMNWKFAPDVLVRNKHARPQTELKGKQRIDNVKGVFSLNPNFSPRTSHLPFLILDDVYTTGSTLKEAGKVLKRNKAKAVWGFTIAR